MLSWRQLPRPALDRDDEQATLRSPPPTLVARAGRSSAVLCRDADHLPIGSQWAYQLKVDGFFGLLANLDGKPSLTSRSGKDLVGSAELLALIALLTGLVKYLFG